MYQIIFFQCNYDRQSVLFEHHYCLWLNNTKPDVVYVNCCVRCTYPHPLCARCVSSDFMVLVKLANFRSTMLLLFSFNIVSSSWLSSLSWLWCYCLYYLIRYCIFGVFYLTCFFFIIFLMSEKHPKFIFELFYEWFAANDSEMSK